MASGPEHYREAERLLESINNRELRTEVIASTMAVAQVHATLALAAATATARGNADPYDWYAWNKVTGGAS